ncbi:hypothetical protein C8F01DRAFT_1081884 [Mycena amicta]|nr:hypothetical protein C8F01DRAFT_1081884 [Mycena amicta]
MTSQSRSGYVVQNKLHKLRGEHFRRQLNQNLVSRVSVHNTAPTLPRNLLTDAVYSQDKPSRPRDTREALFVCKRPEENAAAISSKERAEVLSLVLDVDVERPRVPQLTLLCLRSLVVSCSDEEFENLVPKHIPSHLRRELLHWTAVFSPLTGRKLKALCGAEAHVAGELVVVGPDAHVREDDFQAYQGVHCSTEWESDDAAPSPLRNLLLISTPVAFSLLLALPPTLTRLALVNIPTPVPLHRLPATCPLVEHIDLSYNTWLASERDSQERLGKVIWSRLKYLTRLGLRRCSIPAGILMDMNKCRWDDVEIIQ